MFLRRLLPKRPKPEVISEPREETDGEVNIEDGPFDVQLTAVDEQYFEPIQVADNVADAAGARNARIITPALRNDSPTPHQANADVHDDEATATVVPHAEDSKTTPDDVTREINRIRLPVDSEGDEDNCIFTAATSSSGMSRSTTLYVIYEVEQEHGVTRSEDDYEDKGWGAEELSATAASSSTESHQTALHDVENHRLSSVQPSALALTADQSTITTMSPYRNNTQDDTREKQLATEEEDDRPLFKFSKQLLIWMDHLLRLDRRRGNFRKN
ncbi:hypothetical protein JMJ35_000812 [Cladonia borealis]|uniref:Uncharacterized protein n=1 Tax=Cladonia borealis TaxID=184061 RepID=A0AA39V7E8_9LECA|nr:hypothetical protein JMJ35_000812 [Cladonia borealis]